MPKVTSYLVSGLLALFLSACSTASPGPAGSAPDSLAYEQSPETIIVELDYLGSRLPVEWQSNHVPELRIYGDGRFEVAGELIGEDGRRAVESRILAAAEIQAILRSLRELGFFDLETAYIQDGAPAQLAEQWIHVRLRAGTWSVLVYPAEWPGQPEAFAQIWAYLLGVAGREVDTVAALEPTPAPTPIRYNHDPESILVEMGEDVAWTSEDLVGQIVIRVRIFGSGRVEMAPAEPDAVAATPVPVGRLSNSELDGLLQFIAETGFLALEPSYIENEETYFGPERWILVRLAGQTQYVTVPREGPVPAAFAQVWERLLNLETRDLPVSPLPTPTSHR